MSTLSSSLCRVSACVLAGVLVAATAAAKTLTVCAAGAADQHCEFAGPLAIQTAVDKAVDGDTVLLRAGTYTPARFRDVTYKEYVIRGFVAIQYKRIALVGEPGVVLDGMGGPPVSAIVVNGGEVEFSNLTLRNFRAGDPEDDLYEGHGIFVIDAAVTLRDVTIERYAKMALSGRGSTQLTASRIRIQDGHVAIWLEESAHLQLCNAVVRNNDSAGVAAYMNATASVYNSVFDGQQDDGLYAEDEASIFATNTLLLNNKPFAVRVIGNARAWVGHSLLFGNAAKGSAPAASQIKWGDGVRDADPKANAAYKLPAALDGDPNVRTPDHQKSHIGLADVAACTHPETSSSAAGHHR